MLVEGTITAQAFKGRDGEPRASLELRADNVRFLGGGQRAEGAPGELREAGAAPAAGEGTLEDEIPF